MIRIIIIAALLSTAPFICLAGDLVGSPAPDFTLPDLETGEMVTLSDFKGQIVVLRIWKVCKGRCRATVPHFKKLAADYSAVTGQGSLSADGTGKPELKILSVNAIDHKKRIESEVKKLGIDHQILAGRKSGIARRYQTIALPQIYIIDTEGIIRHITMYPDYEELKKAVDELYDEF